MLVSQDQSQQIVQTQRIAPHLIQASEILQCSAIELTQAVERELMENPALEATDTSTDVCPGCPATRIGCSHCPFIAQTSQDATVTGGTFSEMVTGQPAEQGTAEPTSDPQEDIEAAETWTFDTTSFYLDGQEELISVDESYDPLTFATTTTNIREQVLSMMRSMASDPTDIRVSEYLVACLDARGWLKLDIGEALADLGVAASHVDAGITRLQSCDPPGIGARDLQECLLLQLRYLQEDGRGNPLLLTIVERYWNDVVQRRFAYIAKKTNSTMDQVQEAIHFLQTELSPNPANKYRDPWEHKPDDKSEAVRPDVIIRRTATGFEVEVLGFETPNIHINARYRTLYEILRFGNAANASPDRREERARIMAKLSAQERQHIIQYVDRANLFLKNIQQRKKTIEKITRCLIDVQQGYIETGSRAFLRPLTRTELAVAASVHESTVSRALLRKYVQLPNQDVLSFEEFFTAAASVKDTIEHLIANEDPANPYSDEKIRKILEESGHEIARRTVVKYRESMRIPASYLRRKH